MKNSRTITNDFRRLLRRATRTSMRVIAKEMHVSAAVVELYANRVNVSPRLATKFRTWAERYAGELRALAQKLPDKLPEKEQR